MIEWVWKNAVNSKYVDLVESLNLASYVRVSVVTVPGTYAVRGSVVDFFPPEHHSPVRVDFSYGRVRLFFFDVVSQSMSKQVSSFVFSVSLAQKKEVALSDSFSGLGELFFTDGVFSWGGCLLGSFWF